MENKPKEKSLNKSTRNISFMMGYERTMLYSVVGFFGGVIIASQFPRFIQQPLIDYLFFSLSLGLAGGFLGYLVSKTK